MIFIRTLMILFLVGCVLPGFSAQEAVASASIADTGDASEPAGLLTPEVIAEVHRKLSVDCFNQCWELTDRKDRTREDTEIMLAMAYSSFLHWHNRPDCKPENLSIAYWQISRAHALAGHFDASQWYAERCLTYSTDKTLAPFYVGYAHEALCRAELGLKEREAALGNLKMAEGRLEKVTDPEEKKLLDNDLNELREALKAP